MVDGGRRQHPRCPTTARHQRDSSAARALRHRQRGRRRHRRRRRPVDRIFHLGLAGRQGAIAMRDQEDGEHASTPEPTGHGGDHRGGEIAARITQPLHRSIRSRPRATRRPGHTKTRKRTARQAKPGPRAGRRPPDGWTAANVSIDGRDHKENARPDTLRALSRGSASGRRWRGRLTRDTA